LQIQYKERFADDVLPSTLDERRADYAKDMYMLFNGFMTPEGNPMEKNVRALATAAAPNSYDVL
jgi:hypothetical protein